MHVFRLIESTLSPYARRDTARGTGLGLQHGTFQIAGDLMKSIFAVAFVALSVSSAYAADLPTRPYTKAPVLAPTYNWSGFYIGGEVGYGWGDSFQCALCGTPAGIATNRYNIGGVLGGGTAGYNWQLNSNWVIGVETDFSFANIKGGAPSNADYGCDNGLVNACNTSVDWFGTVRGRVGYTVNNALFYGTGGWAYGRAKADIDNCADTAAGDCGSANVNGWAAGGGIEYGFTPNWSTKLEYLHVDLGQFVFSNIAGSGCYGQNCSSDAKFDIVRVGLNYRFGAPVVAK